jgi:hypothetical protein
MNARIGLIALALLLAACENKMEPDQCLRNELFKQCMSMVPPGPQSTHYNDWSEVISECGSQAYYQALRPVSEIPKGCKP